MARSYVAKITKSGQFTIPKAMREALSLRGGDYVLFYPQGKGLRLERAAISPAERFATLAARTEQRFAEQGVTLREVETAIRWARENNAESSSTPTT